ncbi:amino acid ABC transporter permease [Pseudoclavibacter caeni]|jgi:polar amino acid transport system permease protein|uniref:Amino acid ABC transporter permease n=1 Tax=Pseudoclavibacter caeni TaxID=908846 RepID=A0A7C8FXI8_9MICO|nr:amino acid ABC transporter permease [Pseudoclavibacter caeni]KAB1632790.1 amino acid ABC transporter permease [Pseudoclavibacter caeni]NYJ97258.1 polar amino acid transport system permease protein [Pseudoclavibacter caeni]
MSSPARRARISRAIQYAILVIVIVVLALLTDWPKMVHTFFNLRVAAEQFPQVITTALWNTVVYTLISFWFGLLGGALLALMRMSSVAPYRWIATVYTELFRGLPALLVFVAFGYGIPSAFSINLNIYVTVMLSLGMVSAAYISETLRAGLQAVPPGQYEAARSLGMSRGRAMRSIVFPQAFRMVLPPLTNELILLTKDTSLVYLLGLTVDQYELTKFGRQALSAADAGLTPLVVAGVCYLVITVPLSWLARRFELQTTRTSFKAKAAK